VKRGGPGWWPHFQGTHAVPCVYPTRVGFRVTADGGWCGVFGRHVAQSQLPFGARDPVVSQRPSRLGGLEVTVAAPKCGPRFRAYVHTPGWERVLAVGTGSTADAAMLHAEGSLSQAIGNGVRVNLPAQPMRRASEAA
jgi:hypothetical protein